MAAFVVTEFGWQCLRIGSVRPWRFSKLKMPELAVSVHNKKKKQEEILLQWENVIIPVRSFLKISLWAQLNEVTGSNLQHKVIHCLLTILTNLKSDESKQTTKKKLQSVFEYSGASGRLSLLKYLYLIMRLELVVRSPKHWSVMTDQCA